MLNPNSSTSAVLAAVIRHLLPAPKFPAPWDFLPPPADGYGTIGDPARAKAELLAQFGLDRCQRAGVIRPGLNGPRLIPALVRRGGTVVALRTATNRDPFALLAGTTCLPAWRCPIRAIGRDHWAADRPTRTKVVFGVSNAADVLLFRAMGLAATLAANLRFGGLRTLGYLLDSFVPARFPIIVPAGDDPLEDELDVDADSSSMAGPPQLMLVGWQLRGLSARPTASMISAARHLVVAARNLRARFNVSVWIPEPKEIDGLRYLLRLRAVGPACRLLHSSADRMYPIERLAEGPPAPVPFGQTRARWIASLRAAGMGPLGTDQEIDRDAYKEALEQRIVKPLMQLGMSTYDPLVRAGGAQLAGIADFIFEANPYLVALQSRELESIRQGTDGDSRFPARVGEYLRMVAQYARLSRDMERLRIP